MTCEEIQEKLLTGVDSHSEECEEHLLNCRDCQEYRRMLTLLDDAAVSRRMGDELDSKTKQSVFAAMRRQQSARQMRGYLLSVLSIAACLIVCALPLALYVAHRVDVEARKAQCASASETLNTEYVSDGASSHQDVSVESRDDAFAKSDDMLLAETASYEEALALLECGIFGIEAESEADLPSADATGDDDALRLADSVCIEHELHALALMMCSL